MKEELLRNAVNENIFAVWFLAGSCAIHMVGGISALIGAWILGPRIGKFTKDGSGKTLTPACTRFPSLSAWRSSMR